MFDFVRYMELIATKLKEIQHNPIRNTAFHRITNLASLEELLQNMNKIIGVQMIVEDVMEGNFVTNGNTIIDNPNFRFYIIKHVKTDNFDAKEEAKRECKLIAKKIMSRLLRDNYEDLQVPVIPMGLKNLKRDSFQYFSVGPILDNFWGVEMSFSILEGADVKFVANDWIE